MKTRVLVPELMDDPQLDREDHLSALQGLQRINQWTRNARLAWRPVHELARRLDRDRLRILDVATGGADIPIQLWLKAKAVGLGLEIDACDISSRAIEFAARNSHRAGASLNLLTLDVLNEDIADRYDLVMCSQFLHHLTNEQVEFVLGKMAGAATRRVMAVDLVRSRLNWLQVWFATRVLSRSKVVHVDGPQSIRAAYTLTEMHAVAQRIRFAHFTIESHWPCRFVLVGDVNER